MNDRIKKIRKALNLTMEKFGSRIGVTKSAISNIENGNRNVTDQMVKIIVSEFNVNEHWLRTGEGEMFDDTDTISLDDYCKQKGMTDLDEKVIRAYFNIPPELREKALNYFFENLVTPSDEADEVDEMSVEEAEALYKKSLRGAQKKASAALSITDGTEKIAK